MSHATICYLAIENESSSVPSFSMTFALRLVPSTVNSAVERLLRSVFSTVQSA